MTRSKYGATGLKLGKWRTDLARDGGIKEAVVTVRGGEKTGKYLCAYVTGEEKGRSTEKVKRELGRSLPDYMVPGMWWRWRSCR
ncbi:hypothetical protein P7H16_12970 [Paenibacillus larvae]|nr:hypothetical protein [Paenibacillus larvae]MDT2247644.1 hypothetical protein [Paenibacillus larvae]